MDIDVKAKIIEEIINARKEHNLTQQELGKLCGVEPSIISRIESGEVSSEVETILQVLLPLGKTLAVVNLPASAVPHSRENADQRFGVEEIRRIRDEADVRYQGMTPEEISRDIHEGAKEGYEILERLKREKAARQGE